MSEANTIVTMDYEIRSHLADMAELCGTRPIEAVNDLFALYFNHADRIDVTRIKLTNEHGQVIVDSSVPDYLNPEVAERIMRK